MAPVKDNPALAIRSLPHDDNAEKLILGALLLNSESWDIVEPLVKDSDFYSPVNREIFRALSALVNTEGKPHFDGVILLNYLRQQNLVEKCGGAGYISSLTSLPFISANLKEYCDIVKEASQRRLLFNVSNSLQEAVFDPSADIKEKLEEGSKTLNDTILSSYNENASEYSLGNVMVSTFKEIVDKMEHTGEKDRV